MDEHGVYQKFDDTHDRDVIRRLTGYDIAVEGKVIKPIVRV
jgi:hypothetical protein